MYQGTTPTLTLKVPGYDLTDKSVFASFQSANGILTKTGDDLTVFYDPAEEGFSLVQVTLTQEETLRMKQGYVTVQVRFVGGNGKAYATSKATVDMESVIYKAVIKHE